MKHDKKLMKKHLREVVDVLDKYGIKWWIDCGTLLGFYRDGDIIDGDLDTDIGILQETWNWEALFELHRLGYRVWNMYGFEGKGTELSLFKDDIKTDIYFYYKLDGVRWLAMWNNGGMRKEDIIPMSFPEIIIEEIEQQEFVGQKWNVPTNIEDYLTIRYGSWKRKNPNFNWATSPLNINRNLKIW
jgi:phosphorylcholine metabolism protein LicD